MKIAVPVKSDKKIDNHFGHCEYFKVYTISEDKNVIGEELIASPKGCGCKSNIAADLAAMGVETMLAGGIGDGAINKLAAHQIQVIRNCRGDVDMLMKEYLAGNLKDGGSNCAAHHDHHHGADHVCNH